MASSINSNKQVYRKYIERIGMLYNTRQDIRSFTELLLTLAAISIFSIFAIRPTLTTIISLFKEVDEKNETLKIMDEKINSLSLAQSNFNSASAVLPLLEYAVPNTPSLGEFIRQIEAIAEKNSVLITNIFSEDIALFPSGKTQMQITIEVANNNDNILNFLTDLENLRRPLKPDSVTIRISDEEFIQGGLVLSVKGNAPIYTNIQKPNEE